MITTKGYAATAAGAPLGPFQFERRDLKPHDVLIEILYCGVCHSDIHQVRGEWGGEMFPMVPGHEIVGRVTAVGDHVKKFKAGDLAGVGCMVDSCRTCPSCAEGLEQFCDEHFTGTYNSLERDTKAPTYGGYSNQIVVDENFTLSIAPNLPLASVAPLLCAGITTWSPLRHWKVGPGHRLAVMGLGGLGHMAVKFGVALGAEVTVLSTSPDKQADAAALGAHHFVVTSDTESLQNWNNYFDFIIDTVSATHDVNAFLGLLQLHGTMILVGAPPVPPTVVPFSLIQKRRSLAGSLIGGIRETQEMLDYCAANNIVSDIELIAMSEVNNAYERMMKGDVHYRFVIDLSTL